MTSRIPPSRRDPEWAPQRAAKVVQQQTPGAGRVAGVARHGVSEAVQAALRGRPVPAAAPGGGGGMLGYAEVFFQHSTATDADGAGNFADYSEILTTEGSPGITVDGAGQWSYCTDNVPSVYITTVDLVLDVAGGYDPGATGVTSYIADYQLAQGACAFVGVSWFGEQSVLAGIYLLTSARGPYYPRYYATSTEPLTSLTGSANVYVARFPAP